MEEQTAAVPTLCTAGCGYFGNSGTDGLCSKCFRDQQRRKHTQATSGPASSRVTYQEPRIVDSGGESECDCDFDCVCVCVCVCVCGEREGGGTEGVHCDTVSL